MINVEPRAYLIDTLKAITSAHPASEINQTLPSPYTPTSSREKRGIEPPLTHVSK